MIKALIGNSEVRITDHGYDGLSSDNFLVREDIEGASDAIITKGYPDYPKGSSILVLQTDAER